MDRSTCATLAFAVLAVLAAMALVAPDASGDLPPVWDPLPSFAAVEDEPVTVDLSPYVGDPDTPLDELWLECSDPGASICCFCITTTIHVSGINIMTVFLIDGNSTATEELVLIVEDVNDPPVLKVVQLPDGWVGQTYEFRLSAKDEDDAPWELVFFDDSSLFDILRNGTIAFLPHDGDAGYHCFNITVRDPHGASDKRGLSLFISSDYHGPWFPFIPPLQAHVGHPFVLDLETPSRDDLYLPPEFKLNFTWRIDSPEFVINQTEGLFTWDCPMGPDVGNYLFTITLQDGRGRYHEQAIKVTVLDLVPPIAEAGPDITVGQHERFRLDASGSYDDGGLVRWTFSYLQDSKVRSFDGEVVLHTLGDPGDYRFMLQVEDWGGNLANDTVMVHVLDTEPPVAVAASNGPVLTHETTVLDGSGSHDNVGIISYRWSCWYREELVELLGTIVYLNLSDAGTHTVLLEVVDYAGLASSAELDVVVLDDVPPHSDAGRDILVRPRYIVTLDANGSTDNVGIVSYSWEVVGPNTNLLMTGPWVTATFEEPGTYYVHLTVADAMGNEDIDKILVRVIEQERPGAFAVPISFREAALPLFLAFAVVALVLLRRMAAR